jgi:hypothetical protein
MQTKITAALVRRLLDNPPAKDTSIFDTALPRFALRIKPVRRAGAKPAALFFIRYTAPGGIERCMKIADPDTMSLDEARRAAKSKLALVDAGRDPKKDLDDARAAPTIKQIADAYLQSPEFAQKAAKVQANDRARIESHIVYRIGGEKANAITASAARRLYQQIANDTRQNKRKRQLGGDGAARKVIRLLAAMLRWAVANEKISTLPFSLRDLNLDGDGSREAVITSPEEYTRLFSTMSDMVAAGTLRPEMKAFFILVASTGLRRSEAQTLRWSQVNLDRRQITLTATKSAKLAKRRGRPGTQTEVECGTAKVCH